MLFRSGEEPDAETQRETALQRMREKAEETGLAERWAALKEKTSSRGDAEARRRQVSPLPPPFGRGAARPQYRGVPAFAGHKSILRMYLVGMESIGRFMPTNFSMSAMMFAQWYCATFRGAAFSLGRHPTLNSCQRLFASCMSM